MGVSPIVSFSLGTDFPLNHYYGRKGRTHSDLEKSDSRREEPCGNTCQGESFPFNHLSSGSKPLRLSDLMFI